VPRYIIGNWKMNLTAKEAATLAALLKAVSIPPGVVAGVAPGFLHLAEVARLLSGTSWLTGAQDCADRDVGAATGEVAPVQIRDAGGKFVILGHSERRQIYKERNPLINAKVKAALAAGLTPLICIGETRTEREAGLMKTVLDEQIRGVLLDLPTADILKCWIAYEPVWAIGTGITATPAQIADAHAHIRRQLAIGYGEPVSKLPILYGGSVNPANTREILEIQGVDGCLVGGASLSAGDFTQILACG